MSFVGAKMKAPRTVYGAFLLDAGYSYDIVLILHTYMKPFLNLWHGPVASQACNYYLVGLETFGSEEGVTTQSTEGTLGAKEKYWNIIDKKCIVGRGKYMRERLEGMWRARWILCRHLLVDVSSLMYE